MHDEEILLLLYFGLNTVCMINWCMTVSFYVSVHVCSGGWCGFQQSWGRTGGDHLLVGRVGQVDSLHSFMRRRSDDAGETLPQTEVSLSARAHTHTHSVTSLYVCFPLTERKLLLGRTIWPVLELPRNIISVTPRWVMDFFLTPSLRLLLWQYRAMVRVDDLQAWL